MLVPSQPYHSANSSRIAASCVGVRASTISVGCGAAVSAPASSAARNSTIRRMRPAGSGCPSGNCTDPRPRLYGFSSSSKAATPLPVG